MSLSRLEILERLRGLRVLVVGDLMLDEYLFGDIHRISPEAPVPVVALSERQFRLGGAGNVANNIVALGGAPVLVGACGRDEDGDRLEGLLTERGISHHLVRVPDRMTTRKMRIVARQQHVVRLDQETVQPMDAASRAALVDRALSEAKPQLIILSDYAKGVVSPELAQAVIGWGRERKIPVVVDPKSSDFSVYRGATYLTPNTKEAQAASRMGTRTNDEAVAAARRLVEDAQAEAILLTRGELGMALVSRTEARFVAAKARGVYDVTGAGDTVIALFGMCVAAGADPGEAMALANIAAGVVIGKVGAATCSWQELAVEAGVDSGELTEEAKRLGDRRLATSRLVSREVARDTARKWRQEGRRIVFTNGCFDVLHAGHVILLEDARSRGDVLIVGLNSDASVRRLKGDTRPINALLERARVLAALSSVDLVVPYDEDTPLETVLAVHPHVLAKGGDYEVATIVGATEVMGWGGEVAVIPLLADRSTTAILQGRR